MNTNRSIKDKLVSVLKQRDNGTWSLLKYFKDCDTDSNGSLDWDEFTTALRKAGLNLSQPDMRSLFITMDADGNNEISLDEFMHVMRGPISSRRRDFIKSIFKGIDSNKDGIISNVDIGKCFNPKNHPDVKSGIKTVTEFLKDFFESFSLLSDTGYLTLDQFLEYYINVGSFKTDDEFEAMMTSLWIMDKSQQMSFNSMSQSTSKSLQSLVETQRKKATIPTVDILMDLLRDTLKERGASGIIGIQRKFRIMDDDGDKYLNFAEFKKAIKECNLNFSDIEISQIFSFFDKDKSGSINFDEFITGIRGVLNPKRQSLVDLAFKILDKDGNGIVEPSDIIGTYNASKHPDVLSGKRTADDVLREFLETFDVGGEIDGKVTVDEFRNYYANISASIDDDDYFELMIRNAWHISGGTGWSANSANKRVLVTRSDGSQYVEEIKNDLGLKSGDKGAIMAKLRAQGVNAVEVSDFNSIDNKRPALTSKDISLNSKLSKLGLSSNEIGLADKVESIKQSDQYNDSSKQKRPQTAPSASQSFNAPVVPAGIQFVVSKIKQEIKQRGGLGFHAIQRKFRIMDDDDSKSLSLAEFKKGMKEMNLNLSEAELRNVFNHFDTDNTGTISYEEFIQGVRDPLTKRRLGLVEQAFHILDSDGHGVVDAAEIAGRYNTTKHPEVISGRKTSEEVLNEFLSTFEVGGVVDGHVTLDEFINYYTNLGASIDDDDYFELMIRNAWHISGGTGWSANSANKRVLVTQSDGSETVEEIKNDLGLKAGDTADMMARLRAQGVNANNVSSYGGMNAMKSSTKKPLFKPRDKATRVDALLPSKSSSVNYTSDPSIQTIKSTSAILSPNKKSIPTSAAPPAGILLIITKIKNEIKSRGGIGYIAVQRKFKIMDDDSNNVLNLAEFKKGMKEMNLNISESEMRMVFDHFDTDHNGSISLEEFIQGIRDPLNSRRLALVEQAFAKIDLDGTGVIDATEIASLYNASAHPEVISGRMTATQVLNQFLSTFEVGGVVDGHVTLQEFINYYTNIGASIDNDDYFELMIRNAWHISGGTGWSANSANRRVLVAQADGSETVEEIKNDLGLKASDKDAMKSRLRSQGVGAQMISIFGTGEDNNKNLRPARTSRTYSTTLSLGDTDTTTSTSRSKSSIPGKKAIANTPSHGIQLIIKKIKKEIKSRGGTGYIAVQRKFKIMDDDCDNVLSLAEFKKGMKEMNLNISESEMRMVFDHFDTDHNGSISLEEFIQGIRDPLNSRRLALVEQAFTKLDGDGNGIVDATELISKYNASRHPDVISKKKSSNEVLNEFLSTFEVGGEVDGMLTKQEFINYYTNLGASIDDDDYFELMIRNAWHISGGTGWSANSANKRVLVTQSDGSETVEEIKNDLGLKAGDTADMMARLRAQGVNANNVSSYGGFDVARPNSSKKVSTINDDSLPGGMVRKKAWDNPARRSTIDLSHHSNDGESKASRLSTNKAAAASANKKSLNDIALAKSVEPLLQNMKDHLAQRGARGIIGLQRNFKIMDDDGSQSVTRSEFKKALRECDIELSDQDYKLLFNYFDKDQSGDISFDEFLVGIRGELNKRRKSLVDMAFKVLDKDGNGVIEPNDIIRTYNASKHPDVLSGKRTADDILREFLDTFDVGGEIDGKVTVDEFRNYYANISASIDDDDYFELMIRNAWHISGGTGWSANSANKRVLVTSSDGSQYVEEIKNDLGLKSGDKESMMQLLQAQGVNSKDISSYGEVNSKSSLSRNKNPLLGGSVRDNDRSSYRRGSGVGMNQNQSQIKLG